MRKHKKKMVLTLLTLVALYILVMFGLWFYIKIQVEPWRLRYYNIHQAYIQKHEAELKHVLFGEIFPQARSCRDTKSVNCIAEVNKKIGNLIIEQELNTFPGLTYPSSPYDTSEEYYQYADLYFVKADLKTGDTETLGWDGELQEGKLTNEVWQIAKTKNWNSFKPDFWNNLTHPTFILTKPQRMQNTTDTVFPIDLGDEYTGFMVRISGPDESDNFIFVLFFPFYLLQYEVSSFLDRVP